MLFVLALIVSGGTSFAQGVEQGNFIIDPYYGFPNLGKSITNQLSEGVDDVKITGYGPAGIRLGYMMADQFEVGIDAIFNGFSVSGRVQDSTYNSTTNTYDYSTVDSKATMQRIRIQARFNYHFDVSSPNLDAYIGFGAGTNNRVYKYFENGQEVEDGSASITLIPVSFRVAGGMRYYFTDNIGFNVELGLGGPVVSGGLSVKF